VIGRILGSYRIVAKLGEGGMGAVYLADHQRIARRAAIKVLRPELAHRQALVERFFTEARATSLIRHPGIVDVIDCATAEDCVYIVMEFLEGEPLSSYLGRVGPRLEQGYLVAVRIAEEIASAVSAAHAQQIVHRDLKPDNVFLARQAAGHAAVKILDFGIAKLVSGEQLHHTSTGAMLGTPIYMSPEQCRGAGKVDARADVYSLGCILHEMVAGRPPFLAEGAGELISAHLNQAPPPLSSVAPRVPPALEALVLAMLAKAPDERPGSMIEVGVRLRALRDRSLDGQPLPISGAAPAARSRVDSALPPTEIAGPGGTLPRTQALPVQGSLPRTQALTGAATARTEALPQSSRPRLTTLGASAVEVNDPQRTGRSRRGVVLALAGAALVAGGAVVATRLGSGPQARRPVPAVPPPAPPADEWVTVGVESAPSGLTASVDGQPVPLPLRLRKGAPARAVRLEAPGHLPRTVTVDGSRDRSLALEWLPAPAPAPAASPAAPAPAPPRAPARKKAAPRTAAPPPEAAPGSPLDMKLQ